MINKSLSLLLVAFAMTANFCLAQDNTSSNPAQNQEQSPLEDAVVSLDLTRAGHKVTLSGSDQEISLQKGQHLIVNVNGDVVSRYQLVYREPSDYPTVAGPNPSIYYTLTNPWTEDGWYDGLLWIPVLKEQQKLNATSDNSMSFHFLASNPGIKQITVYVFDDTGSLKTNSVYSTSYDDVASFTLTVTVK